MFSMFKKADAKPVNLVFSIADLDMLKEKNADKLNMVKDLQTDILTLLSVDSNLSTFTGPGPIKIIDEQLSRVLLPDQKSSYLNIMGVIRFLKLVPKGSHQFDDTAQSLFAAIVQDSGSDIYDEIIMLLSENQFKSPITKKSDIFSIGIDGGRMALMISDGMLQEGDDMTKQIMKINENKEVQEKIRAFFTIVGSVMNIVEIIE